MKTKRKQTINIKNIWKKYKLPIIVILVLLLLIIIVSKGLSSNKKINDVSKYTFDSDKLITITEKGLYGFINPNGKVVVKPQYDYIIDNTGKYVVVGKNGSYYILDNSGKVRIESDSSVTYDSKNDLYVADSKLYTSKLSAISPKKLTVVNAGHGFYRYISEDNKTAGLLNTKGKIIYKTDIDEGDNLYVYIGDIAENQEEIYCNISINNQYSSIINCITGKEIVKMSAATVVALGNNLFQIQENADKPIRTIYIKNNKIVFDKKDISDVIFYRSGFIEFKEKDNTLYYDINKDKELKERPNSVYKAISLTEWEDNTGYKKVSSAKSYGIINDNKVILPCEYDKIVFLPYNLYNYLSKNGKDLVLVQQDNKTSVMDIKSRKKVHSFDTTTTINSSATSPFIYYYTESKKIVVYNLLNNKEKEFDAETIDVFGNYFRLHKGKKITYYNLKLQKIYETNES